MLAEFHFLFVKAGKVMAPRVLYGGMKGREGLHDHFAFHVAAPGAASHLGQQLKGPLPSAKIRHVQA